MLSLIYVRTPTLINVWIWISNYIHIKVWLQKHIHALNLTLVWIIVLYANRKRYFARRRFTWHPLIKSQNASLSKIIIRHAAPFHTACSHSTTTKWPQFFIFTNKNGEFQLICSFLPYWLDPSTWTGNSLVRMRSRHLNKSWPSLLTHICATRSRWVYVSTCYSVNRQINLYIC